MHVFYIAASCLVQLDGFTEVEVAVRAHQSAQCEYVRVGFNVNKQFLRYYNDPRVEPV